MHKSVWEDKEETMFDAQLDGQQHWQKLIHEADEYRRAQNAEAGTKKQSSTLRRILSNILSSVTS